MLAAVAPELLTINSVEMQASKMLAVSASWPVASLMDPAANEPIGKLLVVAWKAVQAWPKARIDALSHAFGNFDRVVALGRLVADALGLRLIERQAWGLQPGDG